VTIHDERAAEGVDHLQAAALELIVAARVFLDAAEELVHDRDRVGDAVAAVASIAGAVAPSDLFGRRRRGARPRPTTTSGPIDLDDDDEAEADDVFGLYDDEPEDEGGSSRPGVQHIDVS